MFKKGISQGLKTAIPFGGQIAPISIEGARDEWKKLEDKVIELETDLYFCNRNNKIEDIVD